MSECECLGTLNPAISGTYMYMSQKRAVGAGFFSLSNVCEQTGMCERACDSISHFAEIRATEHIPECERPNHTQNDETFSFFFSQVADETLDINKCVTPL